MNFIHKCCCGTEVPDTGRHNESMIFSRTSEGNANAFFDAFIVCATTSFSFIHSPGAISTPLLYDENDFDNTGLSDECKVRWIKRSGDPLLFESGPTGCPGLGTEFDSAPPDIWNPFYLGGPAWRQYAAFNQETHCVGAAGAEVAYACQKCRVMLPTGLPDFHYNGFLARATSVYSDNGDGTRSLTGMTGITLEQDGPFAPDTWININQPLDFNVDVFRFLVLYETIAEWEARSGYSI